MEIMEKNVVWEELRHDYAVFMKELGVLRSIAHGTSQGTYFLLKEALVSFKRACELQSLDVSPHFSTGKCLVLKLLGSALFDVGEYEAAIKALDEAIFYMKNGYADEQCDLASALQAVGDDDNAIRSCLGACLLDFCIIEDEVQRPMLTECVTCGAHL
ncbi:unnamed protein product [Fraxinus pennsylvanica]|uniref:Uncharacterized protein n=1 Tax=Fraxinus pennsylvanica TaxID=56036 RepID=A0AAD2A6U9_9LAMI|nr:unnamed protein product [Fraxinus pennsylvanica]